VTGVAPN